MQRLTCTSLPVTMLPRARRAAWWVLVEAAQYVPRLGRVSSVDNVLLNATGAGLARLSRGLNDGIFKLPRQDAGNLKMNQ